MYLTTHAAVGVLISQQTTNPWVAFFGAFVSHFVLDFVPHGDERLGPQDLRPETIRAWLSMKGRRVALFGLLDLAGVVALVLGLASVVALPTLQLILLGVIGAALPDLLVSFFPILRQSAERHPVIRFFHWGHRKILLAPIVTRLNTFHRWIHNPLHERLPITMGRKIGVLTQLLILAIFLAAEISTLGK